MTKKSITGTDPEFVAINEVHSALKNLQPDAQSRVLNYVIGKLDIALQRSERVREEIDRSSQRSDAADSRGNVAESTDEVSDDLDGISPVAKKWMARNGLQANQLSAIFSLGVDEIDLVAKTVPGKNKKEKMHSVFLLKGVAAYLGTGAARFTHEQLKEACLHYDAFDAANFAVNFKAFASEVSGSKSAGYTLTARGLASATEIVKSVTKSA